MALRPKSQQPCGMAGLNRAAVRWQPKRRSPTAQGSLLDGLKAAEHRIFAAAWVQTENEGHFFSKPNQADSAGAEKRLDDVREGGAQFGF